MSNEPSIPSMSSREDPRYRLGRALHQNTLTVTSLGRWTSTNTQSTPCLVERLRPEYIKHTSLYQRFLSLSECILHAPLPQATRPILSIENTSPNELALILGQTNAIPLTQIITALSTPAQPAPPKLSTPLALLITDLICAQLQAIHRDFGVFHGLLDPNLISITTAGHVLIDSLPAAVCAHEFSDLIQDPLTVWSYEGQRWVAPEVCYGRTASTACDVYFVGALLYKLITNKAHSEEWQPEWSFFMANLSGAGIDGQHLTSMVRLLHRCLAERPSQRARSITEVRKELDALGLYGQQNRMLGDLQLFLNQLQIWSRTRWAQDNTEAAENDPHTVGKTRVSSSHEALPRPPSTRPISAISQVLADSRYRILEELGVGGMGTVYKVFDTELREELALKVLRQDLIERPGWLERFRRELRLTRELAHPFIVPAYHLESIQGLYFYTMKYIDGFTLKHLIQTQGPLPVWNATQILCSIADALERAHTLGVVHRDLKCSNIMLQDTHLGSETPYRPYLMDFGIAADLSANQLTAAGQLLGTPQYMAPEQAMGETIQPAADIYSFAIVLYESLAGTPPFKGETAVAIYDAQVREDYVPLEQLFPDIHPPLAALLNQCMRPTPDARPNSIKDVHHALLDMLEHLSHTPLRPTFSLSPDEITPCD